MSTMTGTPGGGVAGLGFRSRGEFAVVLGLVAALGAFGFFDLYEQFGQAHVVWLPGAEDALVRLFVVVRTVPILWCRRNPVGSFAAVLAGSLASMLAVPSDGGAMWPWSLSCQVSVAAALAAAGLGAGRRRTVWMAASYVLITLLLQTAHPDAGASAHSAPLALLLIVGEMVVVVGGLELLRERRDTQHALAEQAVLTEAERTRRTLLEDRARIGRELHDVVAHHMSLIAVQAETAPYRIPGQEPETEEEFRSISAAAREAMTDMRKILGLLRAGSAEAETAPQPRLADVPALVAESGAMLEASGSFEDVPPLIGVTAYRIVQESLSNARRHAQGAEVVVRMARTAEAVRLEVANGPAAIKTEPGDGHGITGMRERVALIHGGFEAGPTPDGGFAVVVTLPLAA